MNNSQQNIFHILRQQQLKQQQKELEKVRLSKFPATPPSPIDLYKVHPETLDNIPSSTRIEHQADSDVPRGHSVGITLPNALEPNYIISLDKLIQKKGRQFDPAFDALKMYVPGHILGDTFKVLHHLFDGHSNLFNNSRSLLDPTRYSSTERPSISRVQHTNTFRVPNRFHSEQDIIEHMPKLFTTLMLDHLNSREIPFVHPGQDEIEDLGKLKRSDNSEIDIPKDEKHITDSLPEGFPEKYDSMIREYAPILKDYVKHILEEKSPSTLHDFIGSHKSRNFGILSMLQDLLAKNKE